jgi:hypothetical protein
MSIFTSLLLIGGRDIRTPGPSPCGGGENSGRTAGGPTAGPWLSRDRGLPVQYASVRIARPMRGGEEALTRLLADPGPAVERAVYGELQRSKDARLADRSFLWLLQARDVQVRFASFCRFRSGAFAEAMIARLLHEERTGGFTASRPPADATPTQRYDAYKNSPSPK